MWITGALLVTVYALSMALLRRYIAGQRFTSTVQLYSKTAMVTGANNGIGLETALDLAKRGATVILACRNEEKGRRAEYEVRRKSSNENVFFMQLDLGSLESIRNFATKFLESKLSLDILVNNARATVDEDGKYSRTKDGFEVKMGVNHLGHFLLTNLLLDRMKQSPSARIVVVSSVAYQACKVFDFDNMNNDNPERYKREHNDAYRQSKLANILFTRELSRHLEGSNVTVNALHPGTVVTKALDEFLATFPRVFRPLLYVLACLLLKTPKQGAQTTIYCTVAKELEGMSGQYFVDCQPCDVTMAAKDDKVAEKLWRVSTQMVGL